MRGLIERHLHAARDQPHADVSPDLQRFRNGRVMV
jgi:hypothetical protein